jgi:adenylate cyclase
LNEGSTEQIHVRVGINAGEPVSDRGDLLGTAVRVAARACAHAQPDHILVADVVRQLVAGKGFSFIDQGEILLKGLEQPARLHAVAWRV